MHVSESRNVVTKCKPICRFTRRPGYVGLVMHTYVCTLHMDGCTHFSSIEQVCEGTYSLYPGGSDGATNLLWIAIICKSFC